MTETISHITSMRTEGVLCRVQIMQELKITDLEYGHISYDFGMQFLKYEYAGMSEFLRKIEKEKMFWNWWKSEYMLWEQAFIQWTREAQIIPTLELYKKSMRDALKSELTASGFAQILKSMQHVKI